MCIYVLTGACLQSWDTVWKEMCPHSTHHKLQGADSTSVRVYVCAAQALPPTAL